MYVCFCLPIFHPKRWYWYWRISSMWSQLTNAEGREDDELGVQDFDAEKIEFLTTVVWREHLLKQMGLECDDRAWGFLIQDTGEILWCSDNEFSDKESKQHNGQLLLKAVQEESDFRERALDTQLITDGEEKLLRE